MQLVLPVHAPLQPVKSDRADGEALSVTRVPDGSFSEQMGGHAIRPPATVPEPAPARSTWRVWRAANRAVTDLFEVIVVVQSRLTAARARSLQAGLLKMGRRGEESEVLSQLRLQGFVMPQLPQTPARAAGP